MVLKYKTCAIIPARSGSKVIKDKNILKFNGHPSIAYSIVASLKSKFVDKVVFSSDSNKYLKIAKKYNPNILHKRSKKNSSGNASDLDFMIEIKNFLQEEYNYYPDFFAIIRGNCPTRNVQDIDNAIKIFSKKHKNFTALRSVSKMSETSYKTFYIKNKKLCGVLNNKFLLDSLNLPKEKFKETFSGNGCIDIIKSKNLKKGIIHGSKVYPYITKNVYVDIDYNNDIKYAKFILNNFKYLKINK